jgi:hypothetical protein
VSYDSRSHELTVTSALSHEPIKLLVPTNTQITREGQTSVSSMPADLVAGTLLSVRFASDNQGRGIASQIAIEASPGASFVFSGNISSLDLHSGLMVLADAANDKSYQLSFDPAQVPASRNLHLGEHVRVTASFNSTRYVASAIAVN